MPLPNKSLLADGEVLGPGGEQGHSALSWTFERDLRVGVASDVGRFGDGGTRCEYEGVGYEDEADGSRVDGPYGNGCGGSVSRLGSAGYYRVYGQHHQVHPTILSVSTLLLMKLAGYGISRPARP